MSKSKNRFNNSRYDDDEEDYYNQKYDTQRRNEKRIKNFIRSKDIGQLMIMNDDYDDYEYDNRKT